MSIQMYDFRTDHQFVMVTPRMRACFMQFAPGQVAALHAHDHGDETFLVMEGKAELIVAGESVTLAAGQLCCATKGTAHSLRTLGDEPVTLFLVVAPNVEPTHTMLDANGHRLPAAYGKAARRERGLDDPGPRRPVSEILASYVASSEHLSRVAATNAQSQKEASAEVREALESGGATSNRAALNRMSDQVFATLEAAWSAVDEWNELAARLGGEPPDGRAGRPRESASTPRA